MDETATTIAQDVEDFYAEANEDIVGLWDLTFRAEQRQQVGDALIAEVLTVARLLLARGLVAGDLVLEDCTVRPWEDQQPDSVISQIEREWRQLGRKPTFGEVVYFDRLPGQ